MNRCDLSPLKQIPILDVAKRLGIAVHGRSAKCFSGHDKHTDSLSFEPRRNIWKCFGACGKKGDGITLVMEVLQCDFKSALEWFGREFGVDVMHERAGGSMRSRTMRGRSRPPDRTKPAIEVKSEFSTDPEVYGWLVNACDEVSQPQGIGYLKEHGIPPEVAKQFGLRELRDPASLLRGLIAKWGTERVFRSGLAWGEGRPERLLWSSYTLLFPFYERHLVTYIQGRGFAEKWRYLSLRGIPLPLYNRSRLETLAPGALVHICEGIPDAIALESQGLAGVAPLGANAFRAEWVDLFMRFDVVVLPDGDAGGETFFNKISGHFAERGKAVRRVRLPAGEDVSDVVATIRRKT
jgi:DNA primase